MEYSKGKIYKILNNTTLDVYVGSTCQKLSKRLANHKTKLNEGKQNLLYSKMREIGDKNFYIELVEDYPCENGEQLKRREGEVIREIGTLNEKIAGRTKQEHRDDNRENIQQKEAERYINNKEAIKAKRKEHYQENKERINERHKQYNQENQDKLQEYRDSRKDKKKIENHENWENKKDELKQKNKDWVKQNNEKILCPICNHTYPKYDKSHHLKRKYHQQALENLNNINNVLLQTDD